MRHHDGDEAASIAEGLKEERGVSTVRSMSTGDAEPKAEKLELDLWWNAGSSHMNAAYPAATFQRLGLVSLLATVIAYA